MKIKELVEGTWLYDEILAEGLAAGRDEGREEGRLSALREMIRRYALQRLPSAGPLPRLDATLSAEELQECLDALVAADSPATARRAIERFQ